jgi:hypothetical protein
MGFAKYFEDDLGIMEERRYWMRVEETSPIIMPSMATEMTIDTVIVATIEQLPKTKLKRKTKKLVCCECGTNFLFTGGEQNYYETHNLSAPKRCSKCRKSRRQQKKVLKEEEHEF